MSELKSFAEITLDRWTSHCAEYIAEMIPCEKTLFSRVFVRASNRDWSRSGKNGTTTFLVPLKYDRVYEIQEPESGIRGGLAARRYFAVFNGKIEPLGRGKDGLDAALTRLGVGRQVTKTEV